ncbi:MAG: hypothetical protein QW334_02005 [Thermofilum sp.]
MPYVDLVRLLERCPPLRIKACPRCGGFIYWPYHVVTASEREFYRNKLKCFNCGRFFVLVREGKLGLWKRWPETDERIDRVIENLKDEW